MKLRLIHPRLWHNKAKEKEKENTCKRNANDEKLKDGSFPSHTQSPLCGLTEYPVRFFFREVWQPGAQSSDTYKVYVFFLLAVSTPCTHVFAVFRPVPCETAQHAALWVLQCRQQLTARPAASHVNHIKMALPSTPEINLPFPAVSSHCGSPLSTRTRKSAGGEEARVGVINRRTDVTEWEKVQGWC